HLKTPSKLQRWTKIALKAIIQNDHFKKLIGKVSIAREQSNGKKILFLFSQTNKKIPQTRGTFLSMCNRHLQSNVSTSFISSKNLFTSIAKCKNKWKYLMQA